MKKYNYEATLALVEEVISEEPRGRDFIYARQTGSEGPSCLYAVSGKPDCIVGRVFAKVGVPIEEMEYDRGPDRPKGEYSMDSAYAVADQLAEDGIAQFTPKARQLLGRVQADQDSGRPWGESLRAAKSNWTVIESEDE